MYSSSESIQKTMSLSDEAASSVVLDQQGVSIHHPQALQVKHGLDRVVAFILLILFAPLMIVTAICIKLDSRGPVFFRQDRGGRHGKAFQIIKFRTMTEAASKQTEADHARPGDPRMTRLGKFLRQTSIDELPQLINVLMGDMSLVGPRPHMVYHDECYRKTVRHYDRRFAMKPGLTGWAQVQGFRGKIDTPEDMQKRVDCDIHYVEHWSLWLDVKVLIKTPWVVLRAINAH